MWFASLYARRAFILMILSIGSILNQIQAQTEFESCWPAWQAFRQYYVNAEGRVIDPHNGKNVTTSEGQSYGLFFALVANDPVTFTQILKWTEVHLAKGNLARNIPAWLWTPDVIKSVQDTKNERGIIADSNSASDADLWIAYSLLEAGRLWQNNRYTQKGRALLERIRLREVATLPGLGVMLLPGKVGFSHQLPQPGQVKHQSKSQTKKKAKSQDNEQYWKLNPSYIPLQLIARFQTVHPVWKDMIASTERLLLEGAPLGVAPDWVYWNKKAGFQFVPPDDTTSAALLGSYNAIRVYLWIGMLNEDDPQKQTLMNHYQPLITLMQQPALAGLPPETVTVHQGQLAVGETGPLGFSAALLPFLANTPELLNQQRERLANQPLTDNNYYTSVLRLFGQGFDENYYRFKKNGELLPSWSHKCQPNL